MSRISDLAYIGEGVELGEEASIGPGAVILGPTVIEDGVYIGAGAQIGAPPEISSLPQNAAWAGDLAGAGVRICKDATVREGAIIHQGSYRETTVGAGSWILNRAYLAHDVLVGEASTISAGVSIGGHCEIHDRVNIGMNAVVHQRRIISAGTMIGMGTPVTKDVPPFAKVYGTPPRITGINAVGLERAGFAPELAEELERQYRSGNTLDGNDWLPDALLSLSFWLDWWRGHEALKPMTVTDQ